jgi:hypothetical protein
MEKITNQILGPRLPRHHQETNGLGNNEVQTEPNGLQEQQRVPRRCPSDLRQLRVVQPG